MQTHVLTIDTHGRNTRKLKRFLKGDPIAVNVESKFKRQLFHTRHFITVSGQQDSVKHYLAEMHKEIPNLTRK